MMMILHGGRLSPFVRRVELWLLAQERPFERRYVSAFDTDFGGLLELNPLGRVPVLVIEDGTSLFETSAILDYLEETAPLGRRLVSEQGPARRQQLQTMGLAHGIAEKAVALVYEIERRPSELQWPEWRARIEAQIRNGLAALDKSVGATATPLDGVGISAVCAYDMVGRKFPALARPGLVNLERLSGLASELPAFAGTHPALA